jgi:glycosyltransferase involved in cell wall biosynthesis
VHFVAPVPARELPAFVASADAAAVLYVPTSDNIANALPNGFFVAVAAALPLLYPELPEIRRLADRYELGVPIEPRDPSSIADGIRRLLDRQVRARYRANAEAATAELSWEHEERKLAEILARVS